MYHTACFFRLGWEHGSFPAQTVCYRLPNSVTAVVWGHNKILFCFTLFFFLPSPPVSLILFLASYYILCLFPLLIPLLGLLPDLIVEWLFGRSLVHISARRPTDFLRNFSQSLQVNISTLFQRFYWFYMLPRPLSFLLLLFLYHVDYRYRILTPSRAASFF